MSDSIHPFVIVPFNEALQITPLLDELHRDAEHSLKRTLASQTGAKISLIAQTVRRAATRGTFLSEHTSSAAKLLKSGKATFMGSKTGGNLANIVSKSSGKIVGNAKLAKGAQAVSKLADITLAVITVAHVISGIDTARKLEAIGKDVRFLRDARRISQLSRLEAIYRYAKEILAEPLDDYARRDLHRLCLNLFELRAEWRRELLRELENVKDEEAGFWDFLTLRKESVQLSYDQKKADALRRLRAELDLMHCSIVIQMALAFAATKHEVFLTVSLPDEMREWSAMREKMAEKANFIREASEKHGVTARPVMDFIDALTSQYGNLVSGLENKVALAHIDGWFADSVMAKKSHISPVPSVLANLAPARFTTARKVPQAAKKRRNTRSVARTGGRPKKQDNKPR